MTADGSHARVELLPLPALGPASFDTAPASQVPAAARDPCTEKLAPEKHVRDAEALERIDAGLSASALMKEALRLQGAEILSVARRLEETFRSGARLYACGNGGSACDAMHLVEELVARYKRDRPGLPAHHLMDAATLTCWSNDYEYATAFQRQVTTLMRPGDVLVAISTSGNSPNIIAAAEAATAAGAWTLGLTGEAGGELATVATVALRVPSSATERIQEGHITIIHLLCELLEEMLFGEPTPS
jgi:D-sedoheptulose 7-phosphate isomerase